MQHFKLFFLLLFLMIATSTWASIPAPPANQILGIPDSIFDELVEVDCRGCHNQSPPSGIPVDPTYLPDRHHGLVGVTIPSGSQAPFGDPNGDGLYECMSCHTMVWTGISWELDPNYRDCLVCHSSTIEGTVHHLTATAQGGDCVACHGGYIDNMDDGHYIPTYNPSLVTPWPSDKDNGDDTTVSSMDDQAGNCDYCHNAAPGGTVDPASGVLVFNNMDTHHNTGFGADGDKCEWCHDFITAPDPSYNIRTCQGCHSVDTLHNIQTNSSGQTGDVIVPGTEDPGYGHIGEQFDCWGCHGFASDAAMMPAPSGAIIPNLDTINKSSITSGSDSSITLFGSGFINSVQNPWTGTYDFEIDSDLLLMDGQGNLTTIEPVSITPDTIEAVIPGSLAAGNYQVAVVKGDVDSGNYTPSNPLNLTITPRAVIRSAIASRSAINGRVTIMGSGFSEYMEAVDAGTSVTGKIIIKRKSQIVTATIISWTDTRIVAEFPEKPRKITVNTVFGSVSSRVKRR